MALPIASCPDYATHIDSVVPEDHVVAVNHDHYFNFRLDMDVDGPSSRFVRDDIVAKTLPADHPRRSIWVAETKAIASEKEAMLTTDMHKPSLWRVTPVTPQST